MITRRIDREDWLAGHGYEWANAVGARLARGGGKLSVICLERGNADGLPHVGVFSLKKELGVPRWRRFWTFQRLAARLVPRADAVFCHQNPAYALAVSPWARLCRKPVVSWYAHKTVTWKTRAMLAVSEKVLTSSEEGFRLPSPKVVVVGQGIDTRRFAPTERPPDRDGPPGLRLVTVGRISPIKQLETPIQAVGLLAHERGLKHVHLDIVGDLGLPSQAGYRETLRRLVREARVEEQVSFRPAISHDRVHAVYQSADVFVNTSGTGSLDKAVLEAMACGCPVVTSNEAFSRLLRPLAEISLVAPRDVQGLADRIERIAALDSPARRDLAATLRELVVTHHSLDGLVGKLLEHVQG